MQLTEEARIRLLIDGKEASNNLEVIGAKITEAKNKLKELEKGTQEYADKKKEIRELEKAYSEVQNRMDMSQMTVRQLEKYQKDLVKALKDTVQGTDDYVKTSEKLKEVNGRLDEVRRAVKGNSDTVDETQGVWSKLKGWIIGAFAVEVFIEFGKRLLAAGVAVFELTGKFEKYETVLKNALGGQKEAAAAMELIKDIAANTPISVDEMTESFIKMVNRGLTPTKKEITQLADLAASQGKSFDQLTEAVLDAMMGEGERLKEFGIKMKKNGDDISLSFKGQVVHVKNNEAAIYGAIVAMGAYNGVAGTTSDVSKTLEGRVSNLGDAWDFIQVSIGNKLKPVFVGILDLFSDGVEWLGKLVDASGPVGEGFMVIWDALKSLWEMGKNLFLSLLPEGIVKVLTLENGMKALGTVLAIVGGSVKLVFSSIQLLIDGFIVLGNAGKVALSILKGDFVGAAETAKTLGSSWDTLKTNASKNFGSITDSFKNIWTTTKDATTKATNEVDIYGKVAKQTTKELTDEEKKQLEKRAEEAKKNAEKVKNEQIKNNKEALKAIDQNWADSLEDELTKRKVKLQQQYEDKVQHIDSMKLDEKTYNDYIESEKKKLISALNKLDDDYKRNKLDNVDKISKKEVDANDISDKMHEKLHNRIINWEDEKQRKAEQTKIKQIEESTQTFNAIDLLLQGDVRGFLKGMGDKLTSVQKFKVEAMARYQELFQAISSAMNGVLDIFGSVTSSLLTIEQNRHTIQMNNLDAKKTKETEGLRDSLADQTTQINNYDIEIARLRVLAYEAKDKDRQADLLAEITKLEKEREGVVLNRDLTTLELERIDRKYEKEMNKLKLEAWNRQKKLEIAMAIINGAQSVLKALASAPPPANFILAGVATAAAAVQIAAIKSQRPPDFGEDGVYMGGADVGDSTGGGTVPDSGGGTDTGGGGRDNSGSEQSYGDGGVLTDDSYFVNNGVLGGLRHNTPEGGNWVINPRTGKLLAKVEAGEFMGVFSREVTKQHEPLLRRLANSSLVKTGKPVYAEQGYFGNLSDLQGSAAEASFLAAEAKKDLNAINEQTAEMVEVLKESATVLMEVKVVLADIAETSRITSEKELTVNIRNIIEVADEIADVSNQSSFG